jgi:tRNA A-37 threonylcarbamoyl transferase component Bud32
MKRYHLLELKQTQGELSAPFELTLPLTQSPAQAAAPSTRVNTQIWHCVAILRWLPGKRLVLHLRCGQRQQLAKIFFTRKDLKRELRGYKLLQRNGISTAALDEHFAVDDADSMRDSQPVCTSSGQRGSGRRRNTAHVILYQWLEADTLEQLDHRAPLHTDSPALLDSVATVAAMHRQGLRQVDIHPGNFLYDGQTLWLVDSAAVRGHRSPLRARLARENLADLLAQFFPAQIDDFTALWQRYRQEWPQPNWQLDDLPAAIDKMRALRWRHYKRKLSRSCSEFRCTHSRVRFQIWRRDCDSDALRRVLSAPDAAMAQGQALKLGNTATVASVDIANVALIIKRYNIKNWRHRLNRCWRPSRGWRSWHNAHFLLFNGIPTPQPIALIEERHGPLRGRAFFICEKVAGDDLKTYLGAAQPSERQAMLATLGGIIGQYWIAGISHGDMKADNFIVSATGLSIIDLDPMAHHRSKKALQRALTKDIKRFIDNFEGDLRNNIAQELATHLPPALGGASRGASENIR